MPPQACGVFCIRVSTIENQRNLQTADVGESFLWQKRERFARVLAFFHVISAARASVCLLPACCCGIPLRPQAFIIAVFVSEPFASNIKKSDRASLSCSLARLGVCGSAPLLKCPPFFRHRRPRQQQEQQPPQTIEVQARSYSQRPSASFPTGAHPPRAYDSAVGGSGGSSDVWSYNNGEVSTTYLQHSSR